MATIIPETIILLQSNHPQYTNLTRKLVFIGFPVFDLYDSKIIKSSFIVQNWSNGFHVIELDKVITFTNDNTSTMPQDLDMDTNGNIVGIESTPIPDFDWLINWLFVKKDLFKLFQIISVTEDIKRYNIDRTDGTQYSNIDLKYLEASYLK